MIDKYKCEQKLLTFNASFSLRFISFIWRNIVRKWITRPTYMRDDAKGVIAHDLWILSANYMKTTSYF